MAAAWSESVEKRAILFSSFGRGILDTAACESFLGGKVA